MIIGLVLAVVLVVGVLIGARIVSDRAGNVPVAMTPLPAPEAESAECTQLIESLPDKLLGHDRADITEPAPAGTAAWASSSLEQVTLRCGVELPLQYTDYSEPVEIEGTQWLVVEDATPESTLATWYSVNREQVVAVTADEPTLGRADNPVEALGEEIAQLPQHDHDPRPAPLSELEAAGGEAAEICEPLLEEVPEILATDWELRSVEGDTAAWTNPGQEPVVLRCGVVPPAGYTAGERLTQINDVPWFEDTELVAGSTASVWYALGRATDIAVSTPQAAAQEVLVQLSDLIVEETPEQ